MNNQYIFHLTLLLAAVISIFGFLEISRVIKETYFSTKFTEQRVQDRWSSKDMTIWCKRTEKLNVNIGFKCGKIVHYENYDKFKFNEDNDK